MRFLSDFEKSTVAFALGMSVVVVTLVVKTQAQVEAIILTLGIPLIFYGIWAFYELRRERGRRVLAARNESLHLARNRQELSARMSKQRLEVLFGESPNENPLAYVPAPHRGERRVLLPRDHEVTKQRILSGRGEPARDEIDEQDQWHD